METTRNVVGSGEGGAAAPAPSVVATGGFHMLAIGINRYQHWPRLQTAVNGARELAGLLQGDYGFTSITQLLDEQATRASIIGELSRLVDTLQPDDSLLIYFAGHGHLDRQTQAGSWIPVDAKVEQKGRSYDAPGTWLQNVLVRDYLKSCPARHILVVSDSCFAGDFLRGTREAPPVVDDAYVRAGYRQRSRQVLTAGGLQPVTDGGLPDHSVFTGFLLHALREHDSPWLLPAQLHEAVRHGVAANAAQQPLLGALHETGGELGGEFVFFRRGFGSIEAAIAERQRQLTELEEARQAADGARVRFTAAIEAKKAEAEQLAARIEALEASLGAQAGSGGLDELVALTEQREREADELARLEEKARADAAERAAELARLEAEERRQRRAAFEASVAKYRRVRDSRVPSAQITAAAWRELCRLWGIDPVPPPGELAWDEENHRVVGPPVPVEPSQAEALPVAVPPAPEAAAGVETSTTASPKADDKAEVQPEPVPELRPANRWWRVFKWVAVLAGLVVLLGGGVWWYSSWVREQEYIRYRHAVTEAVQWVEALKNPTAKSLQELEARIAEARSSVDAYYRYDSDWSDVTQALKKKRERVVDYDRQAQELENDVARMPELAIRLFESRRTDAKQASNPIVGFDSQTLMMRSKFTLLQAAELARFDAAVEAAAAYGKALRQLDDLTTQRPGGYDSDRKVFVFGPVETLQTNVTAALLDAAVTEIQPLVTRAGAAYRPTLDKRIQRLRDLLTEATQAREAEAARIQTRLTVELTVPKTSTIHFKMELTARIKNEGTKAASNVVVTYRLPDGLGYQGSRYATFKPVELQPGASLAFPLGVDASAAGKQCLVLSVKASNTADVQEQACTEVVEETPLMLGFRLMDAQGVAKDESKAFEQFKRAASEGDEEAWLMLAFMHYFGRGTKTDFGAAMTSYRNAELAPRKHPPGTRTTAQWLEIAAGRGDLDAAAELADAYHGGRNVGKDDSKAVALVRPGVDREHPQSLTQMGSYLLDGQGVTKDLTRGIVLMRRAAEKGWAPAQLLLADCYSEGTAVRKNSLEAFQLSLKAAKQGMPGAQYAVGVWYYDGKGTAKDLAQSVTWIRKAAEAGLRDAQYDLGQFYESGVGVDRNRVEAMNWYRKAAEWGHDKAKEALKRLDAK